MFDIYVYNTPHNAWTYTQGYIRGFKKLGKLNKAGDITAWHNPANHQALFNTQAEFIVMIGPEHHRSEIFGTPQKQASIQANKNGKKLIAICYESSVDPFGQYAWAKAGIPWLLHNYYRYGSRTSQCYNTNKLDEQFKYFDYVFTQDEVDVKWFREHLVNAYWLPACADADVFKPLVDRPVNRAGFIGNVWWPRDELHKSYPFAFDIRTVEKAPFDAANAEDIASNLAKSYGSYAIGVNMRSPFAGVSMRTFELMACGIFPIVYEPAPDRVQNKALFAGWDHIVWFNEWSDADVKKVASNVNHLVTFYDQCRQRGAENRRLILDKHTPVHRIQEIIKHL
jgi:hypothetical protein